MFILSGMTAKIGVHLGIDLGGTEIKAAVLTPAGEIRARIQLQTHAFEGRDAVCRRLAGLVPWAREVVPDAPLETIGVAIPGVLDMETGRVELLTNLTPDWNGFLLRPTLEDLTGMRTPILNDVRAATFAEHVWGAGTSYTDFLCVAIGTGVGGGLVLCNHLYTGSRGAAGEIGHMTVVPDGRLCNCGNQGCLETVASGPALTRAARIAIENGDVDLAHLADSHEPSPLQLAAAARRGSAGARDIFAEAGCMLGLALSNLVTVLNPQAVIVGGGVSAAGDLLLDPIRAEIARRVAVFSVDRGGVQVIASPLGGHAGAMGAAAWAMHTGGER